MINLEQDSTITYRTTERIFVCDGKAYSEKDAPDGSSLLAGEGGTITAEDAEKYGLAKGTKADAKAQVPAENKAQQPAENKVLSTDSFKTTKPISSVTYKGK